MGTKNDTVIAHLGARIGELSRRCRTLATMCNDLVSEKNVALARVREVERVHGVQARRLKAANDELEAQAVERRELKADNERLRGEAMEHRQALTLRIQEIEALQAQLAETREIIDTGRFPQASQWPSITSQRARQWPSVNDVDWTVGLDYISPHLTGSWKLVEVRSDHLLRLTRQGAPDGHVRPDVLADMDNNLCLGPGPF